MAYTPTTWVAGDTVTATKLNKLEQGVANAGGVLPISDNDGTLNKTWSEIGDAIASGQIACIYGSSYDGNNLELAFCDIVRIANFDDGTYYIYLMGQDDSMGYSTSSASGYPVFFD